MGTIITICTSKGGGGKTSLTSFLAVHLAQTGHRIAVIDADRNQSFAAWFLTYEGPKFTCVSEIRHVEIVNEAHSLATRHDVVLIDTAGFENQTATFAMGAADAVLIPVMPDRASVTEAAKTARLATGLTSIARRDIPCFVVCTRWHRGRLVERATLADLAEQGLLAIDSTLSDLSAYGKASYSGKVALDGQAGSEIEALVAELKRRKVLPQRAAKAA